MTTGRINQVAIADSIQESRAQRHDPSSNSTTDTATNQRRRYRLVGQLTFASRRSARTTSWPAVLKTHQALYSLYDDSDSLGLGTCDKQVNDCLTPAPITPTSEQSKQSNDALLHASEFRTATLKPVKHSLSLTYIARKIRQKRRFTLIYFFADFNS